MDIKLKHSFLALAIVLTLLGGSINAYAADGNPLTVSAAVKPLNLEYDGMSLASSAGEEAFVIDGVTYVPLRFMANTVEMSVSWDDATSTVKVKQPTAAELIALKERKMNLSSVGGSEKSVSAVKNLVVYRREVTYLFGDIRKETTQGKEGLIYNNRLFVPLRFFSESIGKQVSWDPVTLKIMIKTPVPKPKPETVGEGNAKTEATKTAPATPVLPIGTIGGSIGGESKPSYESLKSSAEAQLEQLKNRCESTLMSIAKRYLESKDSNLITEGLAELAACNQSFDQIVNTLHNDLTKYGYDTSIVSQYRAAFEQLKAEKEREVQGQN